MTNTLDVDHLSELENLHLIIECFDDMVGVFDLEFRCVAFNRALADAVAKADGAVIKIGENILDYIKPEQRAFWEPKIKRVFEGETVSEVFTYTGGTGELLYLQNTYKPLKNKDGEVIGGFQQVQNITQQYQQEKTIGKLAELYREIISNIPKTDLLLTDLDLTVLIAEGESIKQMGLTHKDFVGKTLFQVSEEHGTIADIEEAYKLLKQGIASELNFTFKHVDYAFYATPLYNSKQEMINHLIVFRNITEQVAFEKHLIELNKSKDNILGIVAHDLRNPVSTIIGLADLMKQEPSEAEELLELIRKAGNNALNIISDLLDIASLDNDHGLLDARLIDINKLIREIMDSLILFAEDKELQMMFSTNTPIIEIQADAIRLSRVFSNLIMNAIKFSYRGNPILINTTLSNKQLFITIQDFGMGIPEKYRELIFDKFTKASRKGTEGEKSLGLGMSIVKRILELHHGKIWLVSEENKGTTVHVELPVK